MRACSRKATASVFCLFLLFTSVNGQSLQTIKDIEARHQNCVCTPEQRNHTRCCRNYYFQMDSLLDAAYRKLLKKSNHRQRAVLKNDELAWLKEKDSYFKEQNKLFWEKSRSNGWRTDMETITYDDKANFIKERIAVLIDKQNGSVKQ